jgi:hypothetical protein
MDKKYDLEDRLVDFTCRMIDAGESLPSTRDRKLRIENYVKI